MNSGRGSGARALGELAGDVCREVTEFIVLRLPHSHLQGPSTALKDHSTLFTEREKENTEKRTAWFCFFFLLPPSPLSRWHAWLCLQPVEIIPGAFVNYSSKWTMFYSFIHLDHCLRDGFTFSVSACKRTDKQKSEGVSVTCILTY